MKIYDISQFVRQNKITPIDNKKSIGVIDLVRPDQQTPCASMASTTFSKPAMFAPTT